MEEEFYFGEFFIKSDNENINTNPYEFYKLQVDNNKKLFAWHNLVLKSNKNTLINSKLYYKNLKLEMNKIITKFYEYIACELTKKYLHNTFHSRKLDDEESYVIKLSDIKDSFNKEKSKLNNYIKTRKINMKNSWLNNLDREKIKSFLNNYFKNNNKKVLVDINFILNDFGKKFIEVEIFDKEIDNDFFETAFYLGEYFVLSPDTRLNYINHTTILNSVENYQELNKKWIEFLYNNNLNTKINNKTYKEFLTKKLDENLLYYYENNMAFVLNKYLKNEDGFTESGTFATLKQFKKEYEEEKKNLPKLIKELLNENNKENIK